MPITDGRIQKSKHIGRSRVVTEVEAKRVYERLRKASYRKRIVAMQPAHYVKYVEISAAHHAYVSGVKDALKEII